MSGWRTALDKLQPLGRALMLPIAVLPIAALLLRLGQDDMLAIPFVAAAGDAIFSNLGLLFAAGVAVGIARENHGAAGLAGIVGYLVATEGAKALLAVPPDQATSDLAAAAWKAKEITKLSVPAGIIAGLVAGALYNRFSDIKLPAYLGFFGGRRFVPIAAGLTGIVLALLLGLGFPAIEAGVDALSRWVVGAGPIGLFVYGFLNRLLLVTGLHHVLNNIAWFIVGDFHGTTGDLKRFFAGDPTAGGFMAGFFPVMMFGLPAACLAMYRTALPERRRAVGGLLLSLALTSFLTGVTEPIEFSFLFLAPVLFAVHAVLTGLAMALMSLLGVKLGFGFSAGLFDYVLNFGLATRPLLLLPVGLAYAALYYAVFSWCIRRWDLKTPGREPLGEAIVVPERGGSRAAAFIDALGGAGNLASVNACMTRLRLEVADPAAIDEARLRQLGARGVLKLSEGRVQVVVGPEADQLASAIRSEAAAPASPVVPEPLSAPAASNAPVHDVDVARLTELLRSAGVTSSDGIGRRVVLGCARPERVDGDALTAAGVQAWAVVSDGLHLIVGGDAPRIAAAIRASLG